MFNFLRRKSEVTAPKGSASPRIASRVTPETGGNVVSKRNTSSMPSSQATQGEDIRVSYLHAREVSGDALRQALDVPEGAAVVLGFVSIDDYRYRSQN